ncbi:MAG: hydrogenase expression/formation protein HypE [Thermodesulfobacteriota bacterium]
MSIKRVLLDHGSGGVASRNLIESLFQPRLDNPILARFEDSAVLATPNGRLAFTTDGYVVDPIFFPGGDIGKLAVNGTINDLAMQGARPIGLSLALILEEGFPLADLERLAESIGEAARQSRVPVVTGDTKVVPRGKADKIFITTSGIGLVADNLEIDSRLARPGDAVLLSGYFGDHGVTIMAARAGLAIRSDIVSDTAPLHDMVAAMLARKEHGIHCLRDPTRGGVATVLAEIAEKSGVQIDIDEKTLPLRPGVHTACELLGLDPLYLANEGKCIVIAASDSAAELLAVMRATEPGRDAVLIGRVAPLPTGTKHGRVVLRTAVGGARLVGPLSGEPLPRIC